MSFTSRLFLILSAISTVSSVNGSSTPKELEYVDDYFANIGLAFQIKLQQYGIGNLQVDDRTVPTNRTLPDDVHLEGNITYTNGKVKDILCVNTSHDGTRGDVTSSGIDLHYHYNLRNITLFTDIDGEFKEYNQVNGSGLLLIFNTTIEFNMYQNYTTNNKSLSCEPKFIEAPHTSLQPDDNDLFLDVGRIVRLEYGYSVWWDQIQTWCDGIFIELLEECVEEDPFPIVPPSNL